MNIIILEPDITKREFYENSLAQIADKRDLIFYNSGQDFIDFLENKITLTQQHIDVIISEFNFPVLSFKDILQKIRNSLLTYSYNNFKLSAIPVILYTDHKTLSDFEKLDVDKIILKSNDDIKTSLQKEITSIVKTWRVKIFDDLEVLGIGLDYDFTKLGTGYSVKVKDGITKILSYSFVLKQRPLPYLWLSKDFFEMEDSISELEELISMYLDYPREKLERLNWEDQLQSFFKRNPKFIFQNNFSKFWSTPKINYFGSRKNIKPDLVAQPYVSPELGKNWQIVDLKLPIQDFLQQTDFHKTFTAKFFKCLKQIKDYKKFFNDEKNEDNLKKVFEFHPKNPKLTLILGRRNKLLEEQDRIYENLNEFNLSDVYLLTYDEIVESQKREVERLMSNKLF